MLRAAAPFVLVMVLLHTRCDSSAAGRLLFDSNSSLSLSSSERPSAESAASNERAAAAPLAAASQPPPPDAAHGTCQLVAGAPPFAARVKLLSLPLPPSRFVGLRSTAATGNATTSVVCTTQLIREAEPVEVLPRAAPPQPPRSALMASAAIVTAAATPAVGSSSPPSFDSWGGTNRGMAMLPVLLPPPPPPSPPPATHEPSNPPPPFSFAAQPPSRGIRYTTPNPVLDVTTAASSGGAIPVFLIWYGDDWQAKATDTQAIVRRFVSGLSGSSYWDLVRLYYSTRGNVAGSLSIEGEANISSSSFGVNVSDTAVSQILVSSLATFPPLPGAVYLILGAPDVLAISGQCVSYCGFHSYILYDGSPIKYAFVGSPVRCRSFVGYSSCGILNEAQSPNHNFNADAIVSIVAHELSELATNPLLNAWADASTGAEVSEASN